MRIFDPEVLVRNFTELGFSDETRRAGSSMSESPNGIILVTGPTGSGKTTTLYSTLKQLATPAVNVCTIEDPIEMVEPAFNQMQVQNAIDLVLPGRARADAAGPGHHHGRRNPRPGNRRSGDPGGAHRPPGAVHACTPTTPGGAITRLLDLGVPPTCSRPPCSASWPSAWCASCARTAREVGGLCFSLDIATGAANADGCGWYHQLLIAFSEH
jgi:energy-coupling factor transporter ATP-binding protein EcfA2